MCFLHHHPYLLLHFYTCCWYFFVKSKNCRAVACACSYAQQMTHGFHNAMYIQLNMYCCTQERSVLLHAGLFTQTQEADVLIMPDCGMKPSRKPLTIAALNLKLPRGILTTFKLALATIYQYVLSRYGHNKVKVQWLALCLWSYCVPSSQESAETLVGLRVTLTVQWEQNRELELCETTPPFWSHGNSCILQQNGVLHSA